jgi:hypothetical protein
MTRGGTRELEQLVIMGFRQHRSVDVNPIRQPGHGDHPHEPAVSTWNDIHAEPRPRQASRNHGPFCERLAFSLIYVAAFHAWNQASWWLGALVGMVHAIFVLTVLMAMLPALHPRMANEQQGPSVVRQLEPPGFLALHYGVRTPVSVVLSHLIFGGILGFFYHLG